MANFTALKTAIQNAVRQNGNEEITGNVLQSILLSIVTTLGDSAITALENDISSEATTRQNKDGELQDAIDVIGSAINNGYTYAGIATPSSTPVNAKVFYIAIQAGTYTNYGGQTVTYGITMLKKNGSSWTKDVLLTFDSVPTNGSNNPVTSGGVHSALEDEAQRAENAFSDLDLSDGTDPSVQATQMTMKLRKNDGTEEIPDWRTLSQVNLPSATNSKAGLMSSEDKQAVGYIQDNPQMAYVVCDTAAATAAKTVALTGYVLPTAGGSVKVKMTYANTAADATLNINGAGAKPLYYNGERAGASNSWEAGEVLDIYYDGTNYMANNVAGGGSDGVFDISHYTGASYADLAAALGTNGANVPQSKQEGGMSVKFINSNTSQYEQWRLMSALWSATVTDWQGVDSEPTIDSKNLVESGGVEKITSELSTEVFFQSELSAINTQVGNLRNDGTIATNPLGLIKTFDVEGHNKVAISGRQGSDMDLAVAIAFDSTNTILQVYNGTAATNYNSYIISLPQNTKYLKVCSTTTALQPIVDCKIKEKSITKINNEVFGAYLPCFEEEKLCIIDETGELIQSETGVVKSFYVNSLQSVSITGRQGGNNNEAVACAYDGDTVLQIYQLTTKPSNCTDYEIELPAGTTILKVCSSNINTQPNISCKMNSSSVQEILVHQTENTSDIKDLNRLIYNKAEQLSSEHGILSSNGTVSLIGFNYHLVRTYDVENQSTVYITGRQAGDNRYRIACAYDSNNELLQDYMLQLGVNYTNYKIDLPSGTKYLKVCSSDTRIRTVDCVFYSDLIYIEEFISEAEKQLNIVPSYWESEISSSINSVLTNRLAIGNNISELIFITDTHYAANEKKSSSLVRRLQKELSIDNVVFGGDAIEYSASTKLGGLKELQEFVSDFNYKNLAFVVGNHDLNAYSGGTLTLNEIYGTVGVPMESFGVTKKSLMVDYFDDETQKVRYVLYYYDISNAQTVIDTFKDLSSDWTVVLFTHMYWEGATPPSSPTVITAIRTMMNNIIDGTYNCTIAAFIVGHAHKDLNDVLNNSIPVIGTTTDCLNKNTLGGPSMTAGSDTEQAFDIIQIDTANKKLYFTRVGAGNDREFTYI